MSAKFLEGILSCQTLVQLVSDLCQDFLQDDIAEFQLKILRKSFIPVTCDLWPINKYFWELASQIYISMAQKWWDMID